MQLQLVFGLALALCFTASARPSLHATPPNIIFIMADDLGYSDLGCYGQKIIRTPKLDQLAAEGIRYTQCYAGATVCAPSRSVLMTGQHTGHTTVRGNNGMGGVVGLGGASGRIPLRATDTTIAHVLHEAGYTTAMIGKWGLGEPGTTGMPHAQGFDFFYGFLNQRRAHTYYPAYLWRDTTPVPLPGNQSGDKADYVQDHFLNETLTFLETQADTPFFLYLPFSLPHDKYEIDQLGHWADSTHWTKDEQVYAAMVERLDRDVGVILEKLDGLGLADNTIVFFCSDNGAARRWEGRFESAGNLRGQKRDLYEGGLRVPMIVRYPGHLAAGAESEFPWSFADILPTLSGVAGGKCPGGIDGRNIWEVMLDDSNAARFADRSFYWEFYERGYQQAVRKGPYKAIKLGPEQEWMLYDLVNDPEESNDIAARYPERVAALASVAAESHRPSPFFPISQSGKRQLLLIGDSTVKNGSDDEDMCGWGEVLEAFLDTTEMRLINRARGGRSSKTYLKEGLWREALELVSEGDFVLMQFGHNDGGPIFTNKERGSLPGIGDSILVDTLSSTGGIDTVHTYGWYLRRYIHDARAKGAIPIVCSMVPRNRWSEGRIKRAGDAYGGWARQVAEQEEAIFFDLNELIASRYDQMGEEALWRTFFKDDHTHTTRAGAQLNARVVADELKLWCRQCVRSAQE